MFRRMALASVTLIAVLISACATPVASTTVPSGSMTTPEPTATTGSAATSQTVGEDVDSRLIAANTQFGFRLFAEIVEQDAGKNVFVSPASVAMALAMTYNGAAGETQQAMAEVLELEELSLQEINQANAALRKSLENPDPEVELTIANSLWARAGVGFKPDFLERNRQFFGAEIAELDFDDPSASKTINKWVEDSTKGKIDKIVADKIDPDTVLFLINAIYFKGQWAVKFDASKTEDRVFYLLDGGQKQVPMMSQSGEYAYYRGQGFQAVGLPYGEGRVSMIVFLPGPESSLDQFLESLDAENWANWLSQFDRMEGDIVLPRFKLEYDISLNDALKALGMEIAFDSSGANFEGMRPIPPNLYIKDVKHKTFVEVNEEGTEAAAVTKVEIGIESAPQRFSFVVDRPFFFAIHDHQTDMVLFMGTIVEPE
jgi:serine protease inhibitor